MVLSNNVLPIPLQVYAWLARPTLRPFGGSRWLSGGPFVVGCWQGCSVKRCARWLVGSVVTGELVLPVFVQIGGLFGVCVVSLLCGGPADRYLLISLPKPT